LGSFEGLGIMNFLRARRFVKQRENKPFRHFI